MIAMAASSLWSRLRTGQVSPARFVTLATLSFAGLMVIIPSGALVRLTDSGLGCPDWPGCHGDVVPPLSGHAVIEYSNRIFSAIVVALTIVTWLAARRVPDGPKRMRRIAAVPAIASVLQGPLGGVTVLFNLHPLLVASHFVVSMAALAAGALLVVEARDVAAGRVRTTDRRRALLTGVTLAALAGVVVTGVLVTAAGPHSGDPAVIRRFGNLGDAAAIHVRFVIAFVVLAAAVGIWLLRHRPLERTVTRLIAVFAPLLALQIGVGEYQYRHQLPWRVILLHVTIAGLLWATGAALAWLVARPAAETAQSEVAAPVPVVPEATASRHAAST
jgi:cytochrome c oxidase assembly protein subunit 15